MGLVWTTLDVLFALLVGPLSIVAGVRILSRATAIVGTRLTGLGIGTSDLVAVAGTVHPDETSLTAPFSGDECVLYALEAAVLRRKDSPIHRHWSSTGETTALSPFLLDGETRTVRVDPRREDEDSCPASWDRAATKSSSDPFQLTITAELNFAPGDSLPPSVATVIDEHPALDPPDEPETRYREWALRVGERVWVVGTRVGDDASSARATIRNEDVFLISTESPWRMAVRRILVGGLVTGFGVLLLASVIVDVFGIMNVY